MLIQYIRSPRKYKLVIKNIDGKKTPKVNAYGNDPIGVIISLDRGIVGWSLCDSTDVFDKNEGFKLAIDRANYYGKDFQSLIEEAPYNLQEDLYKMYKRSNRYYKENGGAN